MLHAQDTCGNSIDASTESMRDSEYEAYLDAKESGSACGFDDDRWMELYDVLHESRAADQAAMMEYFAKLKAEDRAVAVASEGCWMPTAEEFDEAYPACNFM